MTKKDKKMSERLDRIYDRHTKIMENMDKLTKEWFTLRKEQEKILKVLGWW